MTLEEATLRILYLALAQFTYRSLPIVLLSVFHPQAPRGHRWYLIGASALFAGVCETAAVPVLSALARGASYLGYFGLAATALYALPQRRALHAVGCLLMFLVMPGLLGTRIGPLWAQESVVLGWEAMFAAYSALVTKPRVALGPYLLFVLVDPTYVYADRSRRRPMLPLLALARAPLGILAVGAHLALVSLASGPLLLSMGGKTLTRVVQLDVYALALGLSHMGLAWMQIGSMAAAGYVTPPRFRNPLWSSSFHNFWQRWNVWLGRWSQVYIFVPLLLRLRRCARLHAPFAAPLGGLGTFILVGALHDLAGFCGRGLFDFRPGFTLLFILFGIALELERALLGWLPQGTRSRHAGRVCFLLVGLPCLIWLSMPALQGNHVHP